MSEPVSVITDCYFEQRCHGEGDLCFDFSAGDGRGRIIMRGYAVIPMEQYRRLNDLAEQRALQLADELLARAKAFNASGDRHE